jgi:hypothetical protein
MRAGQHARPPQPLWLTRRIILRWLLPLTAGHCEYTASELHLLRWICTHVLLFVNMILECYIEMPAMVIQGTSAASSEMHKPLQPLQHKYVRTKGGGILVACALLRRTAKRARFLTHSKISRCQQRPPPETPSQFVVERESKIAGTGMTDRSPAWQAVLLCP